jgi:hypothetical protein
MQARGGYFLFRHRATKVDRMMTRKMTRNVSTNLAIRASGCVGPASYQMGDATLFPARRQASTTTLGNRVASPN